MAVGLGSEHLVIASHNPGKVREIAELVEPRGIVVYSAGEAGTSEPEETGATFAENAAIKARTSAREADMPALADDSGLSVAALDGNPGIHSARWAGPDKDFTLAMNRVREALGEARDWSAAFVCALAVAWPDGARSTWEGRVDGTLVWPPRGNRGFGYDPMFQPAGYDETFGEMDPSHKHAISHRARAFRKLVADLFGDDAA